MAKPAIKEDIEIDNVIPDVNAVRVDNAIDAMVKPIGPYSSKGRARDAIVASLFGAHKPSAVRGAFGATSPDVAITNAIVDAALKLAYSGDDKAVARAVRMTRGRLSAEVSAARSALRHVRNGGTVTACFKRATELANDQIAIDVKIDEVKQTAALYRDRE